MNEIKLDNEAFRFFSAFEEMTRTKALDCFVTENRIVYVVEEGKLGEAIGKSGSRLQRLKTMFRRPVDIVEFSPDPEKFIANIFHRFKINRSGRTEPPPCEGTGEAPPRRDRRRGHKRRNVNVIEEVFL